MSSIELPNNTERVEPKMTVKEKMEFVRSYCNDIINETKIVEAMLAEAAERGMNVNIDEESETFDVEGESGVQLLNLRDRVSSLKSVLYSQGVEMTAEDLKARLGNKGIINL